MPQEHVLKEVFGPTFAAGRDDQLVATGKRTAYLLGQASHRASRAGDRRHAGSQVKADRDVPTPGRCGSVFGGDQFDAPAIVVRRLDYDRSAPPTLWTSRTIRRSEPLQPRELGIQESPVRVIRRDAGDVPRRHRSLLGRRPHPQQRMHRLLMRQLSLASLQVLKRPARIDAQQVKHRRRQVAWLHAIPSRERALFVAGTEYLTPGNATARQRATEHRSPVIAAPVRIDPRRATELADRDHERLFQQPSLVEIFDQCAEAHIELRT